MLSVRSLSCVRGENRLFTNVNFSVNAGQWLHVRGQNGVGKTSLLRILVGLTAPAAGEILWNEQSISANRHEFNQNLLYQGHYACTKDELTALENIKFSTRLDGVALDHTSAQKILHRLGLQGREDLPVRYLSAGQKRRVGMARLLARPAKLWVLDEPLTALDTVAIEILTGLLSEHVAGGGIVVLTSHQSVPLAAGRVLDL